MPALAHAQPIMGGNQVPSAREELAREAQNPLAVRISLAFLDNANFDFGPHNRQLNTLYIQPVIPIPLNADWNIITRTALPIIWQPRFPPESGTAFGLGPTQVTFFASPTRLIHGLILQIPTTMDPIFGSLRWGMGPAVAALLLQGPWVTGVVVNNVWTFADNSPALRTIMTLQPIAN